MNTLQLRKPPHPYALRAAVFILVMIEAGVVWRFWSHLALGFDLFLGFGLSFGIAFLGSWYFKRDMRREPKWYASQLLRPWSSFVRTWQAAVVWLPLVGTYILVITFDSTTMQAAFALGLLGPLLWLYADLRTVYERAQELYSEGEEDHLADGL